MQPLTQRKAINITYSDCESVALGSQHAMRMRRVVICGSAALRYFTTLSHKGQDFRKKKLFTIIIIIIIII
jgi:serine kinase of HPr protein (carbohydrate metabolism regulator)